MRLGQLKGIVDALHELHGSDAHTRFVFQRASGRTGIGNITSYSASPGGPIPMVRFTIEYARGKEDE
jgi:hypothetical protein